MENCCVCGEKFDNIRKLSKHIKYTHTEIKSSQEYYDRYIRGEKYCSVCGKEKVWLDLGQGYTVGCSHKCGAIIHRQNLKEDPERFQQFTDKVRHNQTDIWAQRTVTGEKEAIFSRISEKAAKTASLMTADERSVKYGWLNKLSEPERSKKINDILNNSFFKFWKFASEEEKAAVRRLRLTTMVSHGLARDPKDLRSFDLYKQRVRNLSEANYKKYYDFINPLNLPRGRDTYHLDHILSVCDGFRDNIPIYIVASPFNLQMLPAKENGQKSRSSSTTVTELCQNIQNHSDSGRSTQANTMEIPVESSAVLNMS